MFYEPEKYSVSVKSAALTIKDFSGGIETNTDEDLLPLSYCSRAFNFSLSSGALRDGFGVKKCALCGGIPFTGISGKPLAIYCYKKYDETEGVYVDELLAYASDKKIYRKSLSSQSNFCAVAGLEFDEPPIAVAYTYMSKNVMIFSCGQSMKIYDGSEVKSVSDSPAVTSMCIHNERLFATESGEKTTLWFSDDFDPANWNVSLAEAGFIDLRDGRGSLLKTLEFGGYVYVFRNYGITRITAYGDQTSFSVDGLSASSGKIFGGSITSCGDKIIYLAEDGFYCFTGGAPYRIFTRFDEALAGVDNYAAKGKYFNGRFFASLKMRFDGQTTDCLFVYDFASKSFCVCRGLKIADFELYEGENCFKLLFLCDGAAFVGELSEKSEFFSVPLKKEWSSGKNDFGKPHVKKTVSKIAMSTKGRAELTVESEKGRKRVEFSENDCVKKIGLTGERFKLTVRSVEPNCKISKLKIYYEYGD